MYRYLFVMTTILLFLLGCQPSEDGRTIAKKKKDGIELEMRMGKNVYAEDEKVTSTIQITNHDNEARTITAILPDDKQAISLVHAHQEEEDWYGNFQPTNEIKGRRGGLSENTLAFDLAPGESLEQHFEWEPKVLDPISFTFNQPSQQLAAPSGMYKMYSSILLGEMVPLPDETKEETIQRYQSHPLEELSVQLSFEISGERDLISLEEAKALILENEKSGTWFRARTYEELVKKEKGTWYVKDIDGQWSVIPKEMTNQLKDVEPRFIGGERKEDTMFYYESSLGGSPHRMSVEIDTNASQIKFVSFTD